MRQNQAVLGEKRSNVQRQAGQSVRHTLGNYGRSIVP